MASGVLTACHECDLLQREPILPPGGVARCRRCNAVLFRHTPDSVDRGLAFTLGAAILFIIANMFPIVGLEVPGISNATSLYGAVETIWKNDMEGVAALVFVTTILVPAMEMSLMLYVLLPLKLGQDAAGVGADSPGLAIGAAVEYDAGVHSRRARRAGETPAPRACRAGNRPLVVRGPHSLTHGRHCVVQYT